MKIQFLYHEIIIKQKEYNDMKETNIKKKINYIKKIWKLKTITLTTIIQE